MVKLKIKFRVGDDTAPDESRVSKKTLVLCLAAMFVALCVMVLMAPAKEKEGVAKHYQTLGLKPHASAAEVKKAYRFARCRTQCITCFLTRRY